MPLVHYDFVTKEFKAWLPTTIQTINYQETCTELTITTTGNIDDLDFSNVNLLRLNNASLATVRGLLAGTHGQIVTIVSVGAGQVNLAHNNGSSADANRLLNFVESGITPLAAGKGTCIYQYDGTTEKWRLIHHEQGAWITVPYAAGDYTASDSMTWTVGSVDRQTYMYYLKGQQLTVSLRIDNSTIGGTLSFGLNVTLPNSWVSAEGSGPMVYLNNSVSGAGAWHSTTSTFLELFININGSSNWAADTDGTFIVMDATFKLA
jgi:hypothetical protein